ncbi:MAG: UvrD-helicase domain-containing protein, partial [Patescibacteria group bacterium]
MEKHLEGLNDKQKEAATHVNGPLLVVAGAGAGKTKTITHRIVNLIKSGVAPENILAVTFTNKAAKEMRERIITEIQKNASEQDTVPFVSTFHSLGVHIIKENANILGLTRYFTILDDGDSTSLIKESLKEISIDPKQYDPRKIGNIISREKGKFTHLADYEEKASDHLGKIVAQVWSLYEKKKSQENSLDFDDLLLKSVKLLKENENIREMYQDRWTHIHIDEYQDTNEVQYLMSRLLSEKNKNICVVGDTDQCLAKGTKIKMANGILKKIENTKKGDLILSNFGSGDFREARILNKKIVNWSGEIIQIKTQNGNTIISTPEHTHFAGYKFGITPQIYINYMMYKENTGFRIGTTSIYTKGQKKPILGFVQRSNQEHADALWVISTHKNQQEARVQEYIFSLKYQIPTIPFIPRKNKNFNSNGYVHDQKSLKEIFNSFNTKISGKNLLSDIGLSYENPHHMPQSNSTSRRNINVVLCADKRGKNPMHLISMSGKDKLSANKLKKIGISVRKAKKNSKSWRFETVRANYGETCMLAMKIASLFDNANIVFSARLGGNKNNPKDHNSLPLMPASSVTPGMAIFSINGIDVIREVLKKKVKNKKFFDLDIERTHNFIANNIITHNCIYSWRGANLKNILSFEKDYPDAKTVLLEQNYRSTQNILEAANEVIKKNKYRPDKNLFTKNDVGAKIGLYEALDENDEADFVTTKILEIVDSDPIKNDFPTSVLSEIAILYRANFQSRALEEAMLRYNIPYQVLGVKFFERREIKDTLAYLRAALNRESLSDIKRIINFPARGIGKATLAKIFAKETESLPVKMQIKLANFYKTLDEIREKIETLKVSEVIKFAVKRSGIEKELEDGDEEEKERLENIKEHAT